MPDPGRALTREEVARMVSTTERITKRKATPDSIIPFFVLARSHELLREALEFYAVHDPLKAADRESWFRPARAVLSGGRPDNGDEE